MSLRDGFGISAQVLLVGAGGIGAPAAIALAASGLTALAVADDDVVETSNLHRQILFGDPDVGRPKLDAFAAALRARWPSLAVHLERRRFDLESAEALVGPRRHGTDTPLVVIDATDNFASRFLLADACGLLGVHVVHAAAVGWRATVLSVSSRGRPCYRCLFEDIPTGNAPDCTTAGVVGPVCGIAGALAADRALMALDGDRRGAGEIVTYDGWTDRLRTVRVAPRAKCELCGDRPEIRSLDMRRYDRTLACSLS